MRIGSALIALAAVVSLQGCYAHIALIDVDNNVNTGCTVDLTDIDLTGSIQGIEQIVAVGVTSSQTLNNASSDGSALAGEIPESRLISSSQPLVFGTFFGACNSQTQTFYSDPDTSFPVWPVGLNNGVNGADVIEFAIPRSRLGNSTQAKVVFISSRADNIAPGAIPSSITSSSWLNLPHHTDITAPFLVNLVALPGRAVSAPTLSLGALAVLSLILLWFAGRQLRGTARLVASLTLVMAFAGVVYAATIVLDGEVTDWVGIAPLGTDPPDDSTLDDSGEEITTLFATSDEQNLYLRIDVVDTEAGLASPP